jgi:mRNA interferase HigB
MKIVGRDKLDAFCSQHADARGPVESWLAEAEDPAHWLTPQEIKDRYASASFLAGNIVIFNIKGNDYRLEVLVAYRTGVVVVNWIGPHAEYDARNRRR